MQNNDIESTTDKTHDIDDFLDTTEQSKTSIQVENVESKKEVLVDNGAKPNAKQTEEYSSSKLDYNKNVYTFSLPSITLFDFNSKIQSFNNLNLDQNSSELKQWKKVNEEAVDYYTVGGLYQERFTDKNSLFSQGIETKEGELKTISNLKFKKTDGELKGELAVLKVSKMLGLGDVVNIPLPHSGIWVTIKPPTEKDLIDFYNTIFREKIILGRSTFGLTLSNFSVYINNKLFDFIVKHIHSVNYQDINKNDLKNYILIHDFPILAWGFACSIYPNGFDYQRACVNNVEQCTYIAKAVINMTKLLWIDNPSLTEAQKLIMSENRPNKLTIESYRKFISEHTKVSGTEFRVNDNIKVKLKVPTFNEYITDGLAWVNKINSAIDSAIVEEGNEEEAKTELLNQYVKSSILRQLNHFVDYIEVDDGVINDRDTINDVLELFSSDDNIRSIITENILKFKANTTIGLIGIPEYKCPNCGKSQNTDVEDERFVNVIPLDVMNIFFTLATLRISKILEREV